MLTPSTRLASPPATFVPAGEPRPTYIVETTAGGFWKTGDGPPAFIVRVPTREFWQQLWSWDAYAAGLAFVHGAFDLDGDVVAALRLWAARPYRPGAVALLRALAVRLRPQHWIQSRAGARRNIQFHYDRSNAFYRAFLDDRLVYSCAYFERPNENLDRAQLAKLHHVCRKLDLSPGEAFLDVGCGWGALVALAVKHYGARAVGCTLSDQQQAAARAMLADHGFDDRARIELADYRDVTGAPFDKIASVGMVEHVGRRRLDGYFRTLARLVADTGLVLNHGIVRPPGVFEDAASLFLQRRVFPGGELPRLSEVLSAAERAGFEVLDVENLRPHYALTCQHWVQRLQDNRLACLSSVSAESYRTWLLYLAASAVAFERGITDVYQVLLARRSPRQRRHLTRSYMYRTH